MEHEMYENKETRTPEGRLQRIVQGLRMIMYRFGGGLRPLPDEGPEPFTLPRDVDEGHRSIMITPVSDDHVVRIPAQNQ